MHSFTPVYKGTQRQVEIGLLHDSDSRLADAMLELAPTQTGCVVRRNEPYGPQDGVTHTLKEHALPKTLPNVMIEVRNDLIQTEGQQRDMAILLAEWVRVACDRVEDTSCKA
jgi:predicted N-formylglutamate amidohydrolase